MHANAPRKETKRWDEKYTRFGYLIGAILFHLLLFLMIATMVIWKAPEPPPVNEFSATNVPAPPPAPLPPASGAEANNPHLDPMVVPVPVTTPPSVVTVSVNSTFQVDAASIMHDALSHVDLSSPQGTGLAHGSADNGPASNYGSSSTGDGNGFVGTLYDLKQTPDHKPTDMAENAIELSNYLDGGWQSSPATQNQLSFLRKFVGSWDENMLSDYYKSPNALTATQICVPEGESVDAPKAFKCEGIVRARRWIAIYHAKISPPESGRYRFIGLGDDFLMVRIDGTNVLDGSLSGIGEGLDPTANVKEDVGASPLAGGPPNQCGIWVDMQAGLSVDMSVLIGEGPGGQSGFILMVQKEEDNSAKGDYPLFQLRDGPIPGNGPPSKKKIVFAVSH